MEAIKEFFTNADLVPMLGSWAIKIVIALVIYIIGKWVARRVTTVARNLMDKRNADATLVNFLCNIIYTILLVAVILAALDTLGIPVTSLLAVVGAAGLAIGLATDEAGNDALPLQSAGEPVAMIID